MLDMVWLKAHGLLQLVTPEPVKAGLVKFKSASQAISQTGNWNQTA